MIPRGVLPTLSPQRTCGERKTPYPSAVDSILRLLRIPNSWGWTCGVMLLGLTHIMVKAPRQFYRFTYHAISILCFTSIFFLIIIADHLTHRHEAMNGSLTQISKAYSD
ncbi:hypothetical protein AFLA_005287 [Aspergillus flavus NRRL3357]|nr:hypothetical protein AFLA_005287 [Aspergillus flavus NRRL3357]